jgi:hypothetical protein
MLGFSLLALLRHFFVVIYSSIWIAGGGIKLKFYSD